MPPLNQNIGVKWDEEVARLREAKDWDASLADLMRDSTIEPSQEYLRPFHTYPEGNLCWEAAWEQHLASLAVGCVARETFRLDRNVLSAVALKKYMSLKDIQE